MVYPIPTVGALVTGPCLRVLIVRTLKWRGSWGVPGGKVEWGETLDSALRRELREEVGLELASVQFALLQEAVEDAQFHRPVHFMLINYYAFSATTAVSPNHEIAEWAWVSPQQALDYPLNSFTRRLIQSYLDADMSDHYAVMAEQVMSDQVTTDQLVSDQVTSDQITA
ncbi:NUDIX domain-containing protein [Synechococcus sp. CBW1002]|uniref:NUDIX domain-containing protein n=1 Tax=unclassified Synechococcus TaxID=2626047 RepID=UPI0018CE194A|nr:MULTISPECIES: NUDIX domain-containing protein [unclassified Synechococcus]QPN60577.1 NUDIX domain-containing protein [Synechococcus sp. CBW1002]QPN67712.1 NUDIX domain-containing protein [Synechococcus sp. CBW1006]